jgi:ribonucleoside-triphosphate reductase
MKNPRVLIEDVLKRRTWLLKENSNTQMSPSLIDLYVSSQANEEYALKRLHSADVVKAHKRGSIYIHTLHSPFKPYCNGIDARIFLLDGLRFPHCRSAPAKHLWSAVYQSMAFIFYSQLFFSGAQAIDYFNWFLAPFLRYDRPSYGEVKQALQGFAFQLNQANRTGAQSAFSNVGMRITCPPYLKDEPVVYAGEKRADTYGEFEDEARTLYKALMEVMSEGDGSGAPFTFPLITTAITRDLNWGDELVNATMETASKMGSPYFLNLTTDYLDEKYVHAMCCRLLVEHSGGVWMVGGLGTGSNKVVTINLPHLALVSKSESKFFSALDSTMETARKALQESNEIIRLCLTKWKILPFLRMKTKDGAPYYNFKDRRLTFGVIGLHECLLNLIGEPLTSEEGLKLGLKIITHMLSNVEKFSKEDDIVYTLEQTPAESATHKLASKDKARFGRRAHVQGARGKWYYTNSTHVPYGAEVSIFEKIRVEAEFHPYFTGGAICHIWIGESRPHPDSLKDLVRKLSSTKLAYFTFSPDFSVCANEHVARGKLGRCPVCGAKVVDYINRVVGYFTRVSNWNPGKRKEYEDRERFHIR